MELTPDIQYLIEQYLNGELTGRALQNFEERLAADKSLGEEVGFQREMHQFLAETPENELRKTLSKLSATVGEAPINESKESWWTSLFRPNRNNHFFGALLGQPQLRVAGLGICLLMIAWWFSPVNSALETMPSIAILPFVDSTTQKNQVYLSEGFAEEILHTLATVKEIQVAGQTASFSFKNEATTIAEIGSQLKVAHVLIGSVSRNKNKIRVTAELINVADGFQVWSDHYDKELDDIFVIRDEVLQRIAMTLLSKVAPEQAAKLKTSISSTGKVYDLFLKAKHIHKNIYKSSRDLKDFRQSDSLFMEAIKMDASYALARAGLADLYDSYWVHIQGQEGNTDKMKYATLMEQESRLALQLAPENAYVNQVRGYVLHHLNEPEAAFQCFLKSYRISSKNPESIMGLANLYLGIGLQEDALRFAEEAYKLDPLFKSTWMMQIFANFYLSRWEKTVNLCQTFLKIDSNNQIALEYLFRAYFLLNEKEKAVAIVQKIEAPELLGLNLEIALLNGDTSYIQHQLASNNPNIAFEIYSYRGEKEKAKNAFQQATSEYLKDTIAKSSTVNSLYLDHINNPQLAPFLVSDWFQEELAFEKRKYEHLLKTYPRADKLLAEQK